ncbi:hypothetical protein Maq22A_c05570 [Methylobacterium aquaticum]|uniref:Uncharacterized protein n=1 Tax=Methylobacterium aquaticum TaxID=270351 RepID=A0A0C6FPB8_9HYPH|nr:hypothetical protein Maq22A_c05570 [Methylobacterium aquaticum]
MILDLLADEIFMVDRVDVLSCAYSRPDDVLEPCTGTDGVCAQIVGADELGVVHDEAVVGVPRHKAAGECLNDFS